MDNAWEYHDGVSETRMGKALANGWRQKVFLMTKVCTHGRDAKTAMRMLEESLRRLKTDYLDLWQVHEVAYWGDPERHFAKGGVIEALDRAKAKGLVRFVGFTGHKDPALHLQMLSYGYPFDSCQMPLNCLDATFRSFEQQVLPECQRQGIAAIGMKTFGGEGDMVKKRVVAPADALRYAMSLPVAVTVTGIDSARVLRQNFRRAQGGVEIQRVEQVAHQPRFSTDGKGVTVMPDRLIETAILQRACNLGSELAGLLAGSREVKRAVDDDGQRPDGHDEQNDNDRTGQPPHVAPQSENTEADLGILKVHPEGGGYVSEVREMSENHLDISSW